MEPEWIADSQREYGISERDAMNAEIFEQSVRLLLPGADVSGAVRWVKFAEDNVSSERISRRRILWDKKHRMYPIRCWALRRRSGSAPAECAGWVPDLFACLIFTLTAPTYIWKVLGM